jgi:hypothetical protein
MAVEKRRAILTNIRALETLGSVHHTSVTV